MQIGNPNHEWYLSREIVVPLLAAMSIWAFSLYILVRIQSSWSSLWKCPAMKKPSRDYVPGLKTCMDRKEKNSKMETSEMQGHWKPTQRINLH